MKYRKKPIVIEASQFFDTKPVIDFIHEWSGAEWQLFAGKPALRISTLEGDMIACVGDWIIKGIKGEFYPCDEDIFKATYELVVDK